MGPTATKGKVIFILISASLFSVSMARKIIVGGKSNWTYGFDYITWSFKNAPYFINDTLVFRYDPPVENKTRPHDVILFSNYLDYRNCEVSKGKSVANVSEGGGKGFEYKLTEWKPYFFGCSIGKGIHCFNGTMKFFVRPIW